MKRAYAVPLVAALAVASAPAVAHAQSIIRQPGEHPDYKVEIDPHGILGGAGWYYDYYGVGFGGGARFSIPLCKNCFVPKINNNVAISFGADFGFFPFGPPGYSPAFLYLPVAMQWNFFVTKKWSVGPELGLSPVIGVFYDYGFCGGGCRNWGIYPLFMAIGRYHFNDHVALTLRAGFPELANVGVSFFL
ncbi:MAG TPA: hypothetical protein VGH28_32300 [Polyangiaceae bacterium]|jgi:hypothetical protein